MEKIETSNQSVESLLQNQQFKDDNPNLMVSASDSDKTDLGTENLGTDKPNPIIAGSTWNKPLIKPAPVSEGAMENVLKSWLKKVNDIFKEDIYSDKPNAVSAKVDDKTVGLMVTDEAASRMQDELMARVSELHPGQMIDYEDLKRNDWRLYITPNTGGPEPKFILQKEGDINCLEGGIKSVNGQPLEECTWNPNRKEIHVGDKHTLTFDTNPEKIEITEEFLTSGLESFGQPVEDYTKAYERLNTNLPAYENPPQPPKKIVIVPSPEPRGKKTTPLPHKSGNIVAAANEALRIENQRLNELLTRHSQSNEALRIENERLHDTIKIKIDAVIDLTTKINELAASHTDRVNESVEYSLSINNLTRDNIELREQFNLSDQTVKQYRNQIDRLTADVDGNLLTITQLMKDNNYLMTELKKHYTIGAWDHVLKNIQWSTLTTQFDKSVLDNATNPNQDMYCHNTCSGGPLNSHLTPNALGNSLKKVEDPEYEKAWEEFKDSQIGTDTLVDALKEPQPADLTDALNTRNIQEPNLSEEGIGFVEWLCSNGFVRVLGSRGQYYQHELHSLLRVWFTDNQEGFETLFVGKYVSDIPGFEGCSLTVQIADWTEDYIGKFVSFFQLISGISLPVPEGLVTNVLMTEEHTNTGIIDKIIDRLEKDVLFQEDRIENKYDSLKEIKGQFERSVMTIQEIKKWRDEI